MNMQPLDVLPQFGRPLDFILGGYKLEHKVTGEKFMLTKITDKEKFHTAPNKLRAHYYWKQCDNGFIVDQSVFVFVAQDGLHIMKTGQDLCVLYRWVDFTELLIELKP